MTTNRYRLYARFKGQKTFKALDLSSGQQVINLIYATIFTDEQMESIKKVIAQNDDVEFNIRKI